MKKKAKYKKSRRSTSDRVSKLAVIAEIQTEIHCDDLDQQKQTDENTDTVQELDRGSQSINCHDDESEKEQASEIFKENKNKPQLKRKGRRGSIKQEKPSGLFVCGVCSSSFCNKRKLTFHIKRKHNQHKPIPESDLTCYLCYKTFAQRYNLMRHISRVHKKEKPYVCDRCEKRFSEKRAMVHHRLYQHSNHRCTLCGISFDNPEDFDKHQCCAVFIEGSEKPYGCKTCKKWFGNGSKLHLHVKTHSFMEDDSTMLTHYTCGICTEIFSNRGDFNEHIKIHKKDLQNVPPENPITEDTFIYQPEQIVVKKIDPENGMVLVECDVCGKTLSINSIQKHKKIHSGELNMSSCSICGKVLSNSHNLGRHMKIVHMNVKSFCCEICGKLFAEKRTMTSHMHSQHARNACRKCGISFQSKLSLQRHECLARFTQDTGTGKILYGCKKCEKTFIHKCKLRRHIEKHINMKKSPEMVTARRKRLLEKYSSLIEEMDCAEGSQVESGKSQELEMNEQNVDGGKERLNNAEVRFDKNPITEDTFIYQPEQIVVKKIDHENGMVLVECDVCEKTLSITSIQQHKKIHSGELNMSSCSICGKVLSNSHNLERHMNTVHMNVKSFCCEFCGKLFAEKRTMTSHMHSQHARHACKNCGISFQNKFSLQKHECLAITQDTGRDKILYGCKKCEKTFIYKYKLRRHIEKHINMVNSPKMVTARKKRLLEKYSSIIEEMDYAEGSLAESGKSQEQDMNEPKVDGGKERVNNADGSLDNKGNVYFCEKCNSLFASFEDFCCHQMWHEDANDDTDEDFE
nr:zinc finger protein 2 [Crassostrea gigas]XP_034324456.1 zinc finger protein 2 [Crassostrea gigas]